MIKKRTTIVGHRGCGSSDTGGFSVYPENSIFSIKKAIDVGIDGVELDVWLTKDNKVVVIHGMKNGCIGNTVVLNDNLPSDKIEELTSDEIQSLHYKVPWILTQDEKSVLNLVETVESFSSTYKNEITEEEKVYSNFKKGYQNINRDDYIDEIKDINLFEIDTCSIKGNTKTTHTELNDYSNTRSFETNVSAENKEKKKEEKEEKEENEFVKQIKCSHCKCIYESHISKRSYDLEKKKVIFKYVSLFHHVPLLETVLKIFKNKLNYDLELKGTKENLGLYILDILKDYNNLNIKFSSFCWVLPNDHMRKKMNKHKNLGQLNYESFPHHNENKIDLLKVLKNNNLSIPVALLFSYDVVMPNINFILYSMNCYNATWAHFPYVIRKRPFVINCNTKNKVVSISDFIKIMHKNNKKIMIYWGSKEKDCKEDILFFLKEEVDSICPNDINLAKQVLIELEEELGSKWTTVEKENIIRFKLEMQEKSEAEKEKHEQTNGMKEMEVLPETVNSQILCRQ